MQSNLLPRALKIYLHILDNNHIADLRLTQSSWIRT